MGAEKHITPILLIIVVLIALISTYAWFSASAYRSAGIELFSGTPTSFALSDDEGDQNGGVYSFETQYSGQKGYKPDGTAYQDADAPFYVFKNIAYKMFGQSDVVVTVELEKLTVILYSEEENAEVESRYNYTFDQTLNKVMGLTSSEVSNLTAAQRLNYYVSAADYATNEAVLPSGANPNAIYMVYDYDSEEPSNSKVTHLIFTKSVVETYLTFEYWKSNNTSNGGAGILPTDNPAPTSAKGTGITLVYETDGTGDVSQTGTLNHIGLYLGFYGNDGSKPTECIFSNKVYEGAKFKVLFSAGGM